MGHDVEQTWHVFIDGAWMAVDHAGYAPTAVWVGDRIHPVTFRHLAATCERPACSLVELLAMA